MANFNMNMNDVDEKGRPALQLAFEQNDIKGFILMVAHGCDINVRCYANGRSIMHEACL